MSGEDFADRFAAWWLRPDPDTLGDLLAADVVLRQPLTPDTRGLDAGRRSFRALLAFLPDLAATVDRSAAAGDGVLIEFTLRCTLGGRALAWRAVDRFELGDDGKALLRVSYFDPLPLLAAVIGRPRAWPAVARAGMRLARDAKMPA
ncbi:MAG TPA: nuclear transport factor 2 family protein [Thermoleophilaceae bacterium]|nr:nuclear transport factor 2 family protein [Thermoleophilaceae bacterium]